MHFFINNMIGLNHPENLTKCCDRCDKASKAIEFLNNQASGFLAIYCYTHRFL